MRKISAQRVIGTLVLLLFAALVLLPLFWLGVSAFKSDADVIKWPPIFSRQSGSQHSLPMCGKCSRLPECCLTRLCSQGCHHHQSVFDSMAAYAFARMRIYRKKTALWNHPAHDDDSVSGGDDSTLYGRI